VQTRNHTPRITDVRDALTPGPHLRHILLHLAVFLQTRCQEKLGKSVNVRAGVYVNRDGAMVALHSVSTNQSHSAPFSSYRDHTEGFRVEPISARPSHVVKCLRGKRRIMIEEDWRAAAERGDFYYYSEDQKVYLRSVVLHFLGEVCDETSTMTE